MKEIYFQGVKTKKIDLDYMNTEIKVEVGYAEVRTEVYLNRNDHTGVRKADTVLHTPLQSWEWSSWHWPPLQCYLVAQ